MLHRIQTGLVDAYAGLVFRRTVWLIRRYEKAGRRDRALFVAAFDRLHGAAEHAYGPMPSWSTAHAAQARESLPGGFGPALGPNACGAALLAMFYEALALSERRRGPTIDAVRRWYSAAAGESLRADERDALAPLPK